jgi:hypothetical protein
MNVPTTLKRYPFLSLIFGFFVFWMVILQIIFYYESSNKLFLNEEGEITCKASGKYKVIQNPICRLSANLQGNLFLRNQLNYVQSQINTLKKSEPILQEKIRLIKKKYESESSNEMGIFNTLLSDKKERLKELEIEVKNSKSINDKFRIEYDEVLRSIPVIEESKKLTLDKLLEAYQVRINDLQYQITTNPVELQKLITLEKTIQGKLN